MSAHILENGSLYIRARLTIPSDEIALRVTTSGGPGGQHANRSLTRVVASFHVNESLVLSNADRELLLEKVGPVVRTSAAQPLAPRPRRGQAVIRPWSRQRAS